MTESTRARRGAGLLQPCIALMQRLRLGAKLGLIALAFALPLLWLLGAVTQARMAERSVAVLERDGVRYIAALLPAWQAAAQWRHQHSQTPADAGASASAQARFQERLQGLLALDAELGPRLATSARLAQLRSAAQEAAQATPSAAGSQGLQLVALQRALVELLAGVVDDSGLSLDPDMASYYLVSADLMRGPAALEQVADLGQMGATDPRLPEHLGSLSYLGSAMAGDLKKIREGAPDWAPQIRAVVPESLQGLVAQVRDSAHRPAETVGHGSEPSALPPYGQLAQAALDASFAQVGQDLQTLDAMLAQRQGASTLALVLAVAVAALGLLVAGCMYLGLHAAMKDSMRRLRTGMSRLAMGDLRTEMPPQGRDELACLQHELQQLRQSLASNLQQVRQSTGTVASASSHMALGMQDLSSRTEAAAAALEQSSSALEQTTATLQTTAAAVHQASDMAGQNAGLASHGAEVMHNLVQTMQDIQDSSQKIGDIIAVIDGIAFQTNILALNAAVEAARAGESGRGFAVVATEVRALAGRSAAAAREIRDLISRSTDHVTHGCEVVRQAGTAMGDIVGHAQHIRSLLQQVSTGAEEQSLGIQQIGQAVHELDQSTQANAALVSQTHHNAHQQQQVVVVLSTLVDQFRLPGPPAPPQANGLDVDAMIDAHREWKIKLRDAIDQGGQVDVAALAHDNCCALGRWLHGEGRQSQPALGPAFTHLLERHAHFHQTAAAVGRLINERHHAQAERALAGGTDFAAATAEVVAALSQLKRQIAEPVA